MIFQKDKAKRSLLEEFPEQVIKKLDKPINLIDKILEPYTDAFAIVQSANYASTTEAGEINRFIRWLHRIDNSDWVPPAILFLSQWQNDNQTDCIRWFFEKLERLAACMHVCARNINQRIERYAPGTQWQHL